MGGKPGDRGREDVAALMRAGDGHACRLADDDEARPCRTARKNLDQMRRTETADLLVEGKREMERALQRARIELGDERQRDGDEALHVRSAAAVELALAFDEGERIGIPRLTDDRHDVGVAG